MYNSITVMLRNVRRKCARKDPQYVWRAHVDHWFDRASVLCTGAASYFVGDWELCSGWYAVLFTDCFANNLPNTVFRLDVSTGTIVLCFTEYNRDFIRELHGIHALVESMQTHATDADAVRFCMTALGLLACKNRKCDVCVCVYAVYVCYGCVCVRVYAVNVFFLFVAEPECTLSPANC